MNPVNQNVQRGQVILHESMQNDLSLLHESMQRGRTSKIIETFLDVMNGNGVS